MKDEMLKIPGLTLMEVRHRRLLGGNALFIKQFGLAVENWPECLGLVDADEAVGWLTGGQSSTGDALVGKALWSGNPRWWRLREIVREDQDSDAPRVWVDVEDVTADYELREKERLESQHFHALIERSAEGISLFDVNANILYESPSNKRIHGYDSWEMEGKNLFDFCHEDDLARAMPRFYSLARAPGVVETEIVRFRHKLGHWIYLEGTVINATDDPRVRALVNNFREVTGRLEAERELRRAKDAAEEAHRLQKHFLANLSHEFKTPLTLIRGPLVDLSEGRISVLDAVDVVRRVLHNVDRLDGLISELIDLARLEAGTFAICVQQQDLVSFVRQQMDIFGHLAERRGIRLALESPPVCAVFFDAVKLEKVLSNLLSNALRYSPDQGQVRIVVSLLEGEAINDPLGAVKLSVMDQGPGMNQATKVRVFERFFQADTSDARSHEGMGIGLALAREMVEMHGGRIGVDSEPGVGSEFYFILPLGCEHFDPDDIDTSVASEPRPFTVGNGAATARPVGLVPYAAHRPRLLLVEDNEDMRAYLRMNLDPYYTVLEAFDGLAAWESIGRQAPEIILSDVMMPRLDGLSLCRRLKGDARWREIPLLLLSAKAAVDNRVEGLEAGADDYLGKPFSVAELLQRLRARVPWGVTADAGIQAWRKNLEKCLDSNLSNPAFDVAMLSQKLGYSSRQLQRKVREHFGQSPCNLLLARRLERGRELLTSGHYATVAEVAHAVGLSPTYFSRRYRKAFGD